MQFPLDPEESEHVKIPEIPDSSVILIFKLLGFLCWIYKISTLLYITD